MSKQLTPEQVEQEAVKQAAQEVLQEQITEQLKEQAESPETPYNPNEQLQWRPNDEITISGMEFYTFQRFAEFFEPMILAKQSVLARMVKTGIAKRVVPEASVPEEAKQESKIIPINR